MSRIGGRATALVICLSALAGLVVPGGGAAQTVVGQVREAGSGRPVQAALVILRDAEGTRHGGDLTDAGGEFRIRAPRAGEYRIQVEALGYQTPPTEIVRVEPGRGVQIDLEMRLQAIELDGIDVSGERRCVVRPEEGEPLAELWDEASKALRNQEWNERERRISFRLREYVREFDPRSRTVLSERHQPGRWTSGEPFRSLDAETLLAEGFVRESEGEEGAYEYFAPDASVLLSDDFLNTHCFRLVEDGRAEGLVGLGFEPVDDRANDIRGTLWMGREEVRPHFLEYGYTSSPWREAKGVAGGRVEFEELPGGNWIIRRWWIRMPRMEWDAGARGEGRSGYRVAAVVEQGGSVGRVQQSKGTVLGDVPTGSVAGVVRDSTGSRRLADTEVFLSGTGHVARTDSSGRFRISGVPAGAYDVTFRHPSLDSLGIHPPAREALVLEGETTEVALSLPRRGELLGVLCPSLKEGDDWLAVTGTVRDRRTGEPVPDAVVDLEWKEFDTDGGGRRFVVDVQSRETVSDERGRYRVCGVAPGVLLEARAHRGGSSGPTRRPGSLPYRSVVALDLSVEADVDRAAEPSETAPGTITGRLFDGESGEALAAADIVLLTPEGRAVRHTSSGGSGRFRVRAPEPGRYRVRVQRIGYETTTSPVLDLAADEGLTVQYAMTALPVEIEPLVVTVRPEAVVNPRLELQGYYERKDHYGRRTGFAHFLDGDDLRSNATDLLHLIQDLPGIRVAGIGKRDLVAVDRRGCRVNFFLDGQHVRRHSKSPNAPEVISQIVSPSEIVAIEFYPGRMVPARFMTVGDGAECSAVVIWTGARERGGGGG